LNATSDGAGSVARHVPLLATTRGFAGAGIAECVQYGSIAVVDPTGRLMAGAGDTGALQFARSTLKPVQALPFVQDGGPARYGFGSHELAMMCASHSGETVHLGLVRAMLARIGARPSDLQCGAQIPGFYEATGQARPPRLQPSVLCHNCSGKHSGFLAYCRLHGHRLEGYLDPDGPLQLRVRNAVQSCGGCGSEIVCGIDGCNAPNFALPLHRLARIYARLATDADPALRALFYAMTRHPDLVSGTGRTDLALMQTGCGDWVSKVGADGLQAIGVRSRGLGIVVRVASGNPWATYVAAVEVLHQVGLLDRPEATALAPAFRPAVRNASGRQTGRTLPLFELPRLLA
jgi:L-asparaginase II